MVMCLCTLQAPCQIELEEWINSIHSACAAAFARHRGKTGTLHLLQEEIYRLEKGIESVSTTLLTYLLFLCTFVHIALGQNTKKENKDFFL